MSGEAYRSVWAPQYLSVWTLISPKASRSILWSACIPVVSMTVKDKIQKISIARQSYKFKKHERKKKLTILKVVVENDFLTVAESAFEADARGAKVRGSANCTCCTDEQRRAAATRSEVNDTTILGTLCVWSIQWIWKVTVFK